MPEGLKTLTRYTIEEEHRHPGSTGDFSGLLNVLSDRGEDHREPGQQGRAARVRSACRAAASRGETCRRTSTC